MANFLPFKNYIFYCLDRIIEERHLRPPFLDAGCGTGDLSQYLYLKGWHGLALDFSEVAIKNTRENLRLAKEVKVEHKSLYEVEGKFKSVFLLDVLEHVEDDAGILKKISSLLEEQGYLFLTIPSNAGEWSWDDEFYGHHRRYSAEEIKKKITDAGLETILCWDISLPVFWVLRRFFVLFRPPVKDLPLDKEVCTKISTTVNAWEKFNFPFFNKMDFFWSMIYKLQFRFFKNQTKRGHELIVLAAKNGK